MITTEKSFVSAKYSINSKWPIDSILKIIDEYKKEAEEGYFFIKYSLPYDNDIIRRDVARSELLDEDTMRAFGEWELGVVLKKKGTTIEKEMNDHIASHFFDNGFKWAFSFSTKGFSRKWFRLWQLRKL